MGKIFEYIQSIKDAFNKESAYSVLNHLADYKIAYSLVVFVSSILGVTVEADKIAFKITTVATFLLTLIG